MPKGEQAQAVLPVMSFKGSNGITYQINQIISVSYEARVGGKVVLGCPDLKLVLKQIKEGIG